MRSGGNEIVLQQDLAQEDKLERSIEHMFELDEFSLSFGSVAVATKAALEDGAEDAIDDWLDEDAGRFRKYLKTWFSAFDIRMPSDRTFPRNILSSVITAPNAERGLRNALVSANLPASSVATLMSRAAPHPGPTALQVLGITETITGGIGGNLYLDSAREAGIEKWQWKTVHDSIVDEDCEELDGQVFDIDEPFEPQHPNCRCFPAAYTGDEE